VKVVRLFAAVLAGAAATAALGGCGGSGPAAPSQPFGTPPPPAPGVHAWAAGEVGTLLVTADGGADWRRQQFFLSERGVDVAFTDARDGWLITDAGAMLTTTDGGAAWKVVGKVGLQMKAIAATDAQHAWVVASSGGAAEPGKPVLLRTSDGGKTWKRAAGAFGDAQFADVAFADARHGVLVALDRVWVTHDGGRRWQLSRQQGMSVLTSACSGDASTFWVAGWGTLDGAPFVLVTRDGGSSWRRLSIDVRAPSAGALQAGQLAVAGARGPAAATRLWLTCPAGVLASTDAGQTWTLRKVAAGQPVAIAAVDDQHLLATTSGQPVLATSDGGTTWLAWGTAGFLKQQLTAVAAAAAPAGQ